MKINIRELDDIHISLLPDLFNNNCFYFKTKRPESLNEGCIRELVKNKNSKTFLVFLDESIYGIIAFENDRFDQKAVALNLAFKDIDFLTNNIDELSKFIYELICDKYDSIKVSVYDFDNLGKKFCDTLSFEVEAILKKHVFKYDTYHDVIVYTKNIKSWRDSID